jgi:hypothetical protein
MSYLHRTAALLCYNEAKAVWIPAMVPRRKDLQALWG